MLHPLAETHSCIIMYETQKKHTQNGCNESGSNNKITFMMGYAVVCCCHSKKKKKKSCPQMSFQGVHLKQNENYSPIMCIFFLINYACHRKFY